MKIREPTHAQRLGNGSRKRRFSNDPAKRRWYAWSRAVRFRKLYFSINPPELIVFVTDSKRFAR